MKKIILVAALILVLTGAKAQDYSAVYIIGGATQGGWDCSQALKMVPVAGEDAVFTWEGYLKADEFKFISLNSWYWPGFLATSEGEIVVPGQTHRLRYSADMIDEDYKFVLGEAGNYKVTVDLKNLTMTVEQGRPQVTELWIEGSAVPGGVQNMTLDAKGYFCYNGRLDRGMLRVMTTAVAGDGTVFYVPWEEDTDIQDGSLMSETTDASAAGYGVAVPSDYYRIRINLSSRELSGAPFRAPACLYLVGGATEAGWDAAIAIPFTPDEVNPYLFTCRAELKIRPENVESNLFKILGQLDWGPYSLHPYTAEKPVTEADYVLENEGDDKWSVPDDMQGWYLLTVDVWNGTIKGEYLGTDGIASVIEVPDNVAVRIDGGSVVLDSCKELYNARLLSMSGSMVDSSNGAASSISLGRNLTPGVYIVCADKVDGQAFRQKVCVGRR